MKLSVQAMILALAGIGLLASSQAKLTPQCEYNIFPIYAGGTSNEHINCFAYDPSSELILVGGNTTSSDFAPAANDHGFLFAIDTSGNWKWGKFFYNVSYAISDVSGC